MIIRLTAYLIVTIALLAGTDAIACEAMAKTELEKLYCQVKAKGQGRSLPRFDDFKRNPESTQRLLLKRPANRAGLELPASKSPKASSMAASASRKQVPAESAGSPPRSTGMSGCEFDNQMLRCGPGSYRLLDNRPNRALQKGALTEANQLRLPPVPELKTERQRHRYLLGAYADYLQKMHTIGLAGATLSYSKFYYIFDDADRQQQDFVKRFADMFTYLKKDKQSLAVQKVHARGNLPKLAHCEIINSDWITCDENGKNWVFFAN